MDDSSGQNGSGNGKVYVRFGPRPTQEMPLEWAEKMLAMLKSEHAPQFGKMLARVINSE